MLVTRFNPFKELRELERKLYTTYEDKESNANVLSFAPSISAREGEFAYHIDIDLPGVKKEDISVDVNDGILTVSGERKYKNETTQKDYHRIESSYGKFLRSFTMPDGVDVENINASFADGVLEIVVPKAPKEINKQKIEIK